MELLNSSQVAQASRLAALGDTAAGGEVPSAAAATGAPLTPREAQPTGGGGPAGIGVEPVADAGGPASSC